MSNLTLSVVIPTCDRPIYLREAVESVLGQTLPASEILVVDNGLHPVDLSSLPYTDKLRVIRALPKFGVSQARNLGAILSTGEYVAFLDDDDKWDSGYLQEVHRVIKGNAPDIVLGCLRDGATGKPIPRKQAEFLDGADLIRQILLRNPGAVGSNTVIKRESFLASAGYDPSITTGQDKALVLDLLFQGAQAERAPQAWVDFRDDGQGPRQTDLQKRIKGKRRFLCKYWKHMSWYCRSFNLAQLLRMLLKRCYGTVR